MSAREEQSAWRGPAWPMVVLAIATFLLYIPLFFNAFTTWDDSSTLWGNPSFNPPTLEAIARYWLEPFMDLYVPVTYTLWGVLSFIAYSPTPSGSGAFLSTTPFHFTNLALHIGSGVAAYLLLRNLLQRTSGRSDVTLAALIGALLFTLHPVQVESVAWLSGTKDVLYSFLALVALLLYVHPSQGRWIQFAARLAFLLALLSKPTAIVVPAMALAIDLWLLHNSWRTRLLRLGPWFLASIAIAIVAKIVQPAQITPDVPLYLRPVVALDAIGFYLRQLIFPATLVVDYGRNPHAIFQAAALWWTSLLAIIALGSIVIFRRRMPLLLLAAILFLLPLGPVLGLVPFDFQTFSTVTDHYLYLAMFGVALLVALILIRFARTPAVNAIATILIVVLGIRSAVQITTWRDSQTLFTHVIKANPLSWPAGNNLAVLALERGDPLAAARFAEHAIVRKPPYPDLFITLGRAYVALGRLEEAQRAYEQAVAITPTDASALASLAAITAQRGDRAKGMDIARRAIELDPAAAEPHMNLGIMLAEAGDTQAAAEEIAKAVELDPASADARVNLAILLWELNRRPEAAQHMETATRLRPTDTRARQFLQEMRAGRF